MIFVTTSRLSPWYVEGRDVTVNPTLNQLVSGAYGDAPEPQNQFSELEEMERDWQQQIAELRNQ